MFVKKTNFVKHFPAGITRWLLTACKHGDYVHKRFYLQTPLILQLMCLCDLAEDGYQLQH